jgi:hypothetical protein
VAMGAHDGRLRRLQSKDWRIAHAFSSLPWQGGYSAVSFYNQLKYLLPKRERPNIISIRYSSPGWIELGLIVATAVAVERLVRSTTNSLRNMNDLYDHIMRGLHERKLLRLETRRQELRLREEEMQFVEQSLQQMGRMLQIPSLRKLNELTGHSYISLKILLSLYRRVRALVKFQLQGKVDFHDE